MCYNKELYFNNTDNYACKTKSKSEMKYKLI